MLLLASVVTGLHDSDFTEIGSATGLIHPRRHGGGLKPPISIREEEHARSSLSAQKHYFVVEGKAPQGSLLKAIRVSPPGVSVKVN